MNVVWKLALIAMLACPFGSELSSAETRPAFTTMPPGIKAFEATGIHNFFALSTNLFSGSSPEGENGFAALARLGIKTIITVDGAQPDVELAHKYGMRYVHIPHGYDGINLNTQARLIKAAQMSSGRVFVHCHHGLHRGPVAAAVICMANAGWTGAQSEAWLKTAGTGSNYAGLYRTVREFHPPTAAQLKALPSEFPETIRASRLVEIMVAIDERWDQLKASRQASYQAPREHPDILPAHEAVILGEHYREARRLPEAMGHGGDFIQRLETGEKQMQEVEVLLRALATQPTPEILTKLDHAFEAVNQRCASCHQTYRDQRPGR